MIQERSSCKLFKENVACAGDLGGGNHWTWTAPNSTPSLARFRAATGMRSMTAASSAICARATAACTKAKGAFASFARRENGRMVLTTWGRSSGFCIDPIEKKPLNHFLPGTPVLSFGTAGCNLTCKFCQNWDISKSREFDTLAHTATPEMIARAAENTGCRSVAFTYNDPTIFLEYAVDVAAACREHGIKTVAVTAGYIHAGPRVEFYRAMDAANVDLKAFTQKFYKSLCSAELESVLETLTYLKHETDVWFEITNLVIPRPQRRRSRVRRDDRLDRRQPGTPTYRCTSPRSTPIGR